MPRSASLSRLFAIVFALSALVSLGACSNIHSFSDSPGTTFDPSTGGQYQETR